MRIRTTCVVIEDSYESEEAQNAEGSLVDPAAAAAGRERG